MHRVDFIHYIYNLYFYSGLQLDFKNIILTLIFKHLDLEIFEFIRFTDFTEVQKQKNSYFFIVFGTFLMEFVSIYSLIFVDL